MCGTPVVLTWQVEKPSMCAKLGKLEDFRVASLCTNIPLLLAYLKSVKLYDAMEQWMGERGMKREGERRTRQIWTLCLISLILTLRATAFVRQ